MIPHLIYQLQQISLSTYLSRHTSINFYFNLYLSTYLISLSNIAYQHLSSLSYRSHTSFSCILLSPYSLIVYLFLHIPLALTRPLVVISLVILLYRDNLPIISQELACQNLSKLGVVFKTVGNEVGTKAVMRERV
jgi:hypothetical protein